jgi:hypothetical protein
VASSVGSVYAQLWDRVVRRGEPLEPAVRTPPQQRPLAPGQARPRVAESTPPTEDDIDDPLQPDADPLWRAKVELEPGMRAVQP